MIEVVDCFVWYSQPKGIGMKNMGVLNQNWNPVRAGGLSQHDIEHLKNQGWIEGITEKEVSDAPIGFSAPAIPSGFTMHNFSIPKGTKYLYNPIGYSRDTCKNRTYFK